MAKKSMVARDVKRIALINKFSKKRTELKHIIKKSDDFEEIMTAQNKLSKLSANSSKVRLSSRCQQCGRTHAVYRKFGLCRICLRNELMTGNVTGGRKSSW